MGKKDDRNREKGDSGRCKKQRSKKVYGKKRKNPNKGKKLAPKPASATPTGSSDKNRATDNLTKNNANLLNTTASCSKLADIDINKDKDNLISGFRLLEMSILSNVLSLLACPDCYGIGTMKLSDNVQKKKGLSSFLSIICGNCSFIHGFYTSPQVATSSDKKGRGVNAMEINIRAVYGFRHIGIGFSLLSKLCGILNMPPPMAKSSYENMSNIVKSACKTVAEKCMSDAATSLRKGKKTADVGVSMDGTWQRKGFTSTLGVISALSIDSGKVLDVAIISKSCKGCTRMKKVAKTNPRRYELWKSSHNCNLNFTGSSPAMEKAGAIKIFERSVQKHGLFYTSFYGDGDSKAFPAVKDTYGPKKAIVKKECIGHYQKRVGNRLRKLKDKNKSLGGRGRLTDTKIDTLQNYFGIALRQNVGNLPRMKKSCMASMYHVAGYHESCPMSSDSWCQYQLDRLNNTNHYEAKGELPMDVRQAILPTYLDLCKESMLEKCLHGKTQNANESFNGTIWNRVPKANHVGLGTLCFGVYDAISHFNYGQKASLDTMRMLKIAPGYHMTKSCGIINKERKRLSVYKSSEPQKKRRKILRHLKKKKNDKLVEKEGLSYEAGGF